MTDHTMPPKLATLLLRFFAGEPDFPQIEGDLDEEFHSLLTESGPAVARCSYWREARRNIWALGKRSSTLQVLALAALSVFVFPFALPPFFHWLDNFYVVVQVVALQAFLVALFAGTIALLLGGLISSLLSGHERMLRLSFTGFYLLMNMCLYLSTSGPRVLDIRLLYLGVNLINWSLIIIAFWMGSVWSSRRRLRRAAVK